MGGDPSAPPGAFLEPPTPVLGAEITLDEHARATQAQPTPGWRSLNAVREASFTGEIRFEGDPGFVAYADRGVVYFAEELDGVPLGQRLVGEGALTQEQLHRGMVRVSDDEHLGRLFDRDPSIDRCAVLGVVGTLTETLVAEIAALPAAAISLRAYRHHPSGIHRWFVSPPGVVQHRPLSDVAQVDRSVIDELPDLRKAEPELTIEWNEPELTGRITLDPGIEHDTFGRDDRVDLPDRSDDHRIRNADLTVHLDIEAELDRFDADHADWSLGFEEFVSGVDGSSSTADVASGWRSAPESVDDDFQIRWPDGTREPAQGVAPETGRATPPDDGPEVRDDRDAADERQLMDAPEDVAAAVRRALEAIEGAGGDAGIVSPRPTDGQSPTPLVEPPTGPSSPLSLDTNSTSPHESSRVASDASTSDRWSSSPDAPDASAPGWRSSSPVEPDASTSDRWTSVSPASPLSPTLPSLSPTPVPPSPPAPPAGAPTTLTPSAPHPAGFAPPTLDMRAEAIYERAMAAHRAATLPAADPWFEPDEPEVAALGHEPPPDRDSRRSALRRLIGSLRRSD